MNKCIVKKILLFGCILLFIVAADTYGCGPCFSTFTDCGYPTEMGTCVWDGGGCGDGECNLRCPSTYDHWACMELIGSCTPTWITCAQWEQPTCVIQAIPGGCRCTDAVPQGRFCLRSDC